MYLSLYMYSYVLHVELRITVATFVDRVHELN